MDADQVAAYLDLARQNGFDGALVAGAAVSLFGALVYLALIVRRDAAEQSLWMTIGGTLVYVAAMALVGRRLLAPLAERFRRRRTITHDTLALMLLVITANLSSMAIVRERELGTYEQLSVTPLTRWGLILGKLLPYGAIGMIDVILVVAVVVFWFEVPLRGSLVLLLAMCAVYLLSTLSQTLCPVVSNLDDAVAEVPVARDITGLLRALVCNLGALEFRFHTVWEGPGGQKVMLMSDVGDGSAVTNLTLTFFDTNGNLSCTKTAMIPAR